MGWMTLGGAWGKKGEFPGDLPEWDVEGWCMHREAGVFGKAAFPNCKGFWVTQMREAVGTGMKQWLKLTGYFHHVRGTSFPNATSRDPPFTY